MASRRTSTFEEGRLCEKPIGWATEDWCGVIARCRYVEILGVRGGHCLPSSEWSRRSCIQWCTIVEK